MGQRNGTITTKQGLILSFLGTNSIKEGRFGIPVVWSTPVSVFNVPATPGVVCGFGFSSMKRAFVSDVVRSGASCFLDLIYG